MSLNQLLTQLLVPTVVVFLFAASMLGLAVGIGLMARSGGTLRFIQYMNRWVSTRRALKPLEIPRQVPAPGPSGGRWFGAILIVLGAYSAFVLGTNVQVGNVAEALGVDARSPLTAIAVDSAKWFLVVGSLAAVFTGIMLVFFPRAWRSVEARANHWYSTRQLVAGGDTMHLGLERIVEAFPRASGSVIVAMSLVATIASGMLLFWRV